MDPSEFIWIADIQTVSFQEPKGSSDLYVQKNVWRPDGDTGRHTPPWCELDFSLQKER